MRVATRSTLRDLRSRRTSESGFTILEFAVALVVFSIVASFALPMYFERPEITLENAGRLLAHDLRRAQNRAAYLATTTTVVFDDDGGGYRVQEGPSPALSGGAGTSHRRFDRDGVFQGVRIDDVRIDGAQRLLRFGPRGDALLGGEVVLTFQDEDRTLRIDRGTGHLTLIGTTSGFRDDGF